MAFREPPKRKKRGLSAGPSPATDASKAGGAQPPAKRARKAKQTNLTIPQDAHPATDVGDADIIAAADEAADDDGGSKPARSTKKSTRTSSKGKASLVLKESKPIDDGSESESDFEKAQGLSCNRTTSLKKPKIDFTVPPITTIKDMFVDMVKRGMEHQLAKVIFNLRNRTLRVATMCSGTESPLLAWTMINDGLKKMKQHPIAFDHQFSAEIEPFKQAYIERNFNVPLLFKDIVEMARNNFKWATTAYGRPAEIPGQLDILIVGFSCVDFSPLNNNKKDITDDGQSGQTFRSVVGYAQRFTPKAILIENVSGCKWDGLRDSFDAIGYEFCWVKVDTKDYYIPHTRIRGYAIVVRRALFESSDSARDAVDAWKSHLIATFRRPASSTFLDYLLPEHDPRVQKAKWDRAAKCTGHVLAWEASQARHEEVRQTLGLGSKREFLNWVTDGGCIPREYMDRQWLRGRPDRELDLLEVVTARTIRELEVDPEFKAIVYDISQNPERLLNTYPQHVLSCITPRGIKYLGYKGRTLNGFELLHLQGIPIDQISLTNETDEELSDLAGNAMTTTVIGASILSALLSLDVHGALTRDLPLNDNDLFLCRSERESGKPASEESAQKAQSPESKREEKETAKKTKTYVLDIDPSPPSATDLKAHNPRQKHWLPNVVAGNLGKERDVARASNFLSFLDALRKDPRYEAINVGAVESARKCFCEGFDRIADSPIQRCTCCEHTTCTSCGLKPEHEYRVVKEKTAFPRVTDSQPKTLSWSGSGAEGLSRGLNDIDAEPTAERRDIFNRKNEGRLEPHEFRQTWGKAFPLNIRITGYDEGPSSGAKTLDGQIRARISQSIAEPLSLGNIIRSTNWIVRYENQHSQLEIVLGKEPRIQLFIKPDPSLPLNDPVRIFLGLFPVGKCAFGFDFWRPGHCQQWEWLQPFDFTLTDGNRNILDQGKRWPIQIIGKAGVEPSARSKVGIETWAQETVPTKLEIEASVFDAAQQSPRSRISGTYRHLPRCGTAFSCLYSLEGRNTGDEIFFFMESSKFDGREFDRFVFSPEHERLDDDQVRPLIATLNSAWRPWNLPVQVDCSSLPSGYGACPAGNPTGSGVHVAADHDVALTLLTHGDWHPKPTRVAAVDSQVTVRGYSREALSEDCYGGCEDHFHLATIRVPRPEEWPHSEGRWHNITDNGMSEEFTQGFLWAIRAVQDHMDHGTRPIVIRTIPVAELPGANCSTCAPAKPATLWKRDEGKSNGSMDYLLPYEEPQLARCYETRLKRQPPRLGAMIKEDGPAELVLEVSGALRMLEHKAIACLVETLSTALRREQLIEVTTMWHLDPFFVPSTDHRTPAFTLRNNDQTKPYTNPTLFNKGLKLRPDQARSLQWMLEQESGKVFEIEEWEEACTEKVGWRLSVGAKAKVLVRGGVIADQVSYGKTIISLGLIATDVIRGLDVNTHNGKGRPQPCPMSHHPELCEVNATLVVCPKHLVQQWGDEVRRFLTKTHFGKGKVITVQTMSDLGALTVYACQQARIIIVNWDLFTNEKYVQDLAKFAAIPTPAMYKGRAYAAYHSILMAEMRKESALMWSDVDGFENDFASQRRLSKAEESRFKGNRFGSTILNKDDKLTGVPLQVFKFKRLIVDEFSYVNERTDIENKKQTLLTELSALESESRWLLSGTPPLANFAEVNRVAKLLGISLGVDQYRFAELKSKQRSPAEIFAQFKQARSNAWMQARNEQAAKFLDTFVRQNEADLSGVDCYEIIMPTHLHPDHKTQYLQRAQLLTIIDNNVKSEDDKVLCCAGLLDGTDSPAMALQQSATVFSGDTLNAIIAARSDQSKKIFEQKFRPLLAQAYHCYLQAKELHADNPKRSDVVDIIRRYEAWRAAARDGVYGDMKCSRMFDAAITGVESAVGSTKENVGAPKKLSLPNFRAIILQLRQAAKAIVEHQRGLRFVGGTQLLINRAEYLPSTDEYAMPCDRCGMNTELTDLKILSLCGHTLCNQCHSTSKPTPPCTIDGCSGFAHEVVGVRLHDLVPPGGYQFDSMAPRYGEKLCRVGQLIQHFPKDKMLLFVSTSRQQHDAVRLLDELDVGHVSLTSEESSSSPARKRSSAAKKRRRSADDKLVEFKTDPRTRVLIMSQGDECAAGANLTEANHIIFLCPLLASSQHEYQMQMCQAIGRSRRYGQTQKMFVWRFASLGTIDVDILEQREHRKKEVRSLAANVHPQAFCRSPDAEDLHVPPKAPGLNERVGSILKTTSDRLTLTQIGEESDDGGAIRRVGEFASAIRLTSTRSE